MISLPDLILPKNKHFGLSIERTVFRAVELDDKDKPVHLAEVKIPPEIFEDGVIKNSEIFISAVKKLLEASLITTKYVAVCFPEVFAFTRGSVLPVIPFDEVNEAITWRAKELFPFPQQDIFFDWKMLDKSDKEYRVTVVAVQKKILLSLIETLVKVGLKPVRFEPDASALARLITLKPEEHALIVDVNPSGAYVTLVESDKAVFTTIVANTKGESSQAYLENINRTLDEINTFYIDKGILKSDSTKIFVTGDLATDRWVTHLENLLHYPASILRTNIQDSKYNKAYSAAKEKIAPPIDEHSINLLPGEIQNRYDNERKNRFYETLLGRSGFIIFVLCLLSVGAFLFVSFQLQILEQDISRLRSNSGTNNSNIQGILMLNAQARSIATLYPLKETPKQEISSILSLITPDIKVTQMEYNDSILQYKLTGSAETREGLLNFRDNLEQTELFTNITLPLVSLESSVQVPFILTFVMKN